MSNGGKKLFVCMLISMGLGLTGSDAQAAWWKSDKADAEKGEQKKEAVERIAWVDLGVEKDRNVDDLNKEELTALHDAIFARIKHSAIAVSSLIKEIYQKKRDSRAADKDVLAVKKEIEALKKKIEAIIAEIPEIKSASEAKDGYQKDLRELSQKKQLVMTLIAKDAADQAVAEEQPEAGDSQLQIGNDQE